MSRLPWTRAEIELTLIPKIERKLAEMVAAETHTVKPLPPMTTAECLEYFSRLMDAACERPLTEQEAFVHGQLLSIYKQACWAEALGKKGRFFVIHESQIQKLMDEKRG